MGQPITVVEKRSTANPAILRLETNRPLSGMAHERYVEPPGALMRRPVDELARRLFAQGGVGSVHINGSVVTVMLRGGRTGEGLGDVVRELFLHYGDTPTDTVAVPLSDADAAPDVLADPADAPSAQASADDAPAPDRPGPVEEGAEQQVPGIPDAELAPEGPASGTDGVAVAEQSAAVDAGGTAEVPEGSAVSEREPSPADPADLDAARESAAGAAGAPRGDAPAAGEGGPTVQTGPSGAGEGQRADAPDAPTPEPTPDAERPEPSPLEAEPGDGVSDDDTTSS
jgi:hypothetical protein